MKEIMLEAIRDQLPEHFDEVSEIVELLIKKNAREARKKLDDEIKQIMGDER